MGNRGNQDYYKITGTRTEDTDLAGAARRALTLDEARQRRADHQPTGPRAAPVPPPPPVPTTKERRRAARVRRAAERHQVPLSALPHDESVVRARAPRGAPPTMWNLAMQAARDGAWFGVHLAERLALRLLRRALGPVGRAARLADTLSGGAVTRLF